jgi:hypothetical protein
MSCMSCVEVCFFAINSLMLLEYVLMILTKFFLQLGYVSMFVYFS